MVFRSKVILLHKPASLRCANSRRRALDVQAGRTTLAWLTADRIHPATATPPVAQHFYIPTNLSIMPVSFMQKIQKMRQAVTSIKNPLYYLVEKMHQTIRAREKRTQQPA